MKTETEYLIVHVEFNGVCSKGRQGTTSWEGVGTLAELAAAGWKVDKVLGWYIIDSFGKPMYPSGFLLLQRELVL